MQTRKVKRKIKEIVHKLFPGAEIMRLRQEINLLNEFAVQSQILRRQIEHPNPFCRFGSYGFSQSDEDGITLEIVRRLAITEGRFLELGVGNGLENNTLILLALGWRGVWLGGEDLAVNLDKCERLDFERNWITRENVVDLISRKQGKNFNFDVVSVDLDGNDFFIVEAMLEAGVSANIFIVEYNARFPAGVEFCVDYDAKSTWTDGGDYFGASLEAFCRLFERYGYSVICCNAATGCNAFFVNTKDLDKFPEVPKSQSQIYSSPFYYTANIGHAKSLRTVQRMLDCS